ncbi:Lcl C-terminal domain-containing protein [Methanoplanus endosymbiosus]|uniref:DUF1566 domain-containing protein n=1 Tax=Methanoplanus endosymbiosus TaxID=33865 RepID=A0A9E7TJQ7_9EURY|nr:DUF1566 domain-containing protein [Methanoplanus endosymbiosus]UUX91980.1 DUF1566 domain-containing protein [Methanoplanus endosymbiosus]
MKYHKGIIALIAAMAIAALFAGCVSQTDNSGAVSGEETPATVTESTATPATATGLTYPIVDTNQGLCFDNSEIISCPAKGEAFYGQDAQYTGITPSYTDNGDGTVTDEVTGLIWAQDLTDSAMSWKDAGAYCEDLVLAGYDDWRLPTVKELWSIRDFSQGHPWVDTDYFYLVGDGSDLAQHHSWTSNLYLIESEYQNEQVIGDPAWIVNDWTGHIKAMSGKRFVRAIRGDTTYGINDFVDNGDGTVTDKATGLMWSQDDNGEMLYWEEALAYAESATISGYDDWRLPNIKELQSIADYSAEEIPAMDTGVFSLTEVTNVIYDSDGNQIDTQVNYPFYWSGTSSLHIEEYTEEGGEVYVEGGSSTAWFFSSGYNTLPSGYDLHGAGSVCFGAKSEENAGVENSVEFMVRLVRGGDVTETPNGDPATIDNDRVVVFEDGDTGMGNRGGSPGGEQGSSDSGEEHEMPDLTAAATELGITEEELKAAMGEPGQSSPDFATVAVTLGITEAELTDALENSAKEEQR